MKQKECPFRLQYSQNPPIQDQEQPYRFAKGRDMHNHNFIDSSILQNEEISENKYFSNLRLNSGQNQKGEIQGCVKQENANKKEVVILDQILNNSQAV